MTYKTFSDEDKIIDISTFSKKGNFHGQRISTSYGNATIIGVTHKNTIKYEEELWILLDSQKRICSFCGPVVLITN